MTEAYRFEDGTIRALDWQPRRTLRWAAWRPDGAVMLAVGNGGCIARWDGRQLTYVETNTRQNLRGAAWSPDGLSALVVGNRGAILRLRGDAVYVLDSPTTENLRRVIWRPDGRYALIAGNAGVVLRYEAADGSIERLPGDRAHTLRSMAFRPDGSYALVGAYASRFAGYPRPHPLYRCDGRYLQAVLATEDEDDFVAIDWSAAGTALVCGYAWQADGTLANKLLLFDGSGWQTLRWPARGVVLGGAWRPGGDDALLVGEGGLALRVTAGGGLEPVTAGTQDNLIGPFWHPRGNEALILRGPDDKVYTV